MADGICNRVSAPLPNTSLTEVFADLGLAIQIFAGLGNLETVSTGTLLAAATAGSNALLPYYATAQGGRGVVRASDSAGTHDPAMYTANFNRAQSGLVRVVDELLRRGVSYEQLGALPVSGDWAMESLDAGGRPLEMLNRSPRAPAFR